MLWCSAILAYLAASSPLALQSTCMHAFCMPALECTSKLLHEAMQCTIGLSEMCATCTVRVDALQVQKLASVVHELQTPYQAWRCPALA